MRGKKQKRKPRSQGARSRTKGHSFERAIAIRLREIFPDAKRHLEYQCDEANGVDISGTGPYLFQCKKLKKYAPVTCIQEIKHDPDFDIPVLVTAADREEPMAVLPFSELLILLKAVKSK